MPTARYSCRAMPANRRTSSGSPMAPNPSVSGHWEKAPAAIAAPMFSENE